MSASPGFRQPLTPAYLTTLRRLRVLSIVVAVICAALLPFEFNVLKLPNLKAVLGPAATHVPVKAVATKRPVITPAILSVHNFPRTAIAGHTELFSVHLAGSADAKLIYILKYPNGHTDRSSVRANAHGYSSYTFRLTDYHPRHFREEGVIIRVENASGTLRASSRFAIQKATR